jgi:prepilin-type N-terminal cleavage/methylation domain-containing protein
MKQVKLVSGKTKWRSLPGQAGMTLVEVVVALAISGLSVGALVGGYVFSANSAERSALSLAANAKAMERLEAIRSAKWDLASYPAVDQLVATNFPNQVVVLDLSGSGGGATYATNLTQISQTSTTPPIKRVRVDCIWRFRGLQLVTNTVETCRAPDQ